MPLSWQKAPACSSSPATPSTCSCRVAAILRRRSGRTRSCVRRWRAIWPRRCGRRAILLPGNRDRAILYDPEANAAVIAAGFEVAIGAKLQVATAEGPEQVCIEAGWRFDERNAFVDPADPRDTPLGHHAVAEILPALAGSTTSPWLDGIDRLQTRRACPVS